MATDSMNLALARSIQGKFDTLNDAFGDLRDEVVQLHADLTVDTEATRELFTSLSRILAFSDQLHLTLSIMRDDVRAIECATEIAPGEKDEWWEMRAKEWLRAMDVASSKVH